MISGLEHGFTIQERPGSAASAAHRLEFNLRVRGDLRAEIAAEGEAVRFVDATGASVVNYARLKVWDADGQILPARFAAQADQSFPHQGRAVRISVDDRGARYPITVDPVAQQAYLKASNTDVDDYFGITVAVSGDTVVVGANRERSNATGVNGNGSDNSALFAGAAYVFVRSGTSWTQQAYLKASNTGAGDNFGRSVAVSGDTVVVGAEGEDSSATGVNGNQSDNSAGGAGGGLRLCAQRHHLDAAGVSEGLQHRWQQRPVRLFGGGLRRYGGGWGLSGIQQCYRSQWQPERQQRQPCRGCLRLCRSGSCTYS